jgi:hypothetical protein
MAGRIAAICKKQQELVIAGSLRKRITSSASPLTGISSPRETGIVPAVEGGDGAQESAFTGV